MPEGAQSGGRSDTQAAASDADPLHVGTWRPGLDRYPRVIPAPLFDAGSTALLVIDMQNRAVHPEHHALADYLQRHFPHIYAYHSSRLRELVIPNVAKLLSFFRSHGSRVVYLTLGPTLPDGEDIISPIKKGYRQIEYASGIRPLPPVGTAAHEIISELRPRPEDLVVNKTSASAFNSTLLEGTLRALQIDALICTGLATNACVELTARDAADRGFGVAIVDDATVALDRAMHDACLRNFWLFMGAVMTTNEVISELSRDPDHAVVIS
jgi:nicotinamidase-related amidase